MISYRLRTDPVNSLDTRSHDLKNPHMELPVTLPFIVSTDRQKVDPETRKLIRSHVMRGKNRLKTCRKPRKPVHREKPEELLPPASNHGSVFSSTIIPRLPCSEISTVCFASNVEPARIADVLSFVSMFPKAMFQLNECIISEPTVTTQAWFAPLFFDSAYLYTMCFTVQTYFDGYLGRIRSDEARRRDNIYYAKAIRILQDRLRLDDYDVKLSDSTIMTVLALSGHAYTTGDYDSARDHINGMLQLVSMRGLDNFVRDTKVLIEIVRSDLSTAIDNGSLPVLFAHDNIPWSLGPAKGLTLAPDENSSRRGRSQISNLSDKLHPELAAVWVAMFDFCSLANAAAEEGGAKMTEETFLHSMGSIMYRLLHQRFELGSFDEAVRLGLIAFSSPIFLHWNRVELPDPRFNSTYREALAALKLRASKDVTSHEWTWLLTIAALSMSHEPDTMAWLKYWLRKSVLLCDVPIWTDLRKLLDSFLWIGLIYDGPGKDVFDSILPL